MPLVSDSCPAAFALLWQSRGADGLTPRKPNFFTVCPSQDLPGSQGTDGAGRQARLQCRVHTGWGDTPDQMPPELSSSPLDPSPDTQQTHSPRGSTSAPLSPVATGRVKLHCPSVLLLPAPPPCL